MALNFMSPSMRAAGSDLTISISPLGLVELSDEEFEVHGPRLTRYANAAAMYLGHHWAYARAPGEPQLTANYVAAFSDWMTNFCFSKPMQFDTDPEFQHIVPALLNRIWTEDNCKEQIMWTAGNSGSVYGDVFMKIAYEPEWVDAIGKTHAGQVKIIPINPSFAFPEWHPQDKDRLIRFKLKYRFWTTSPEGTRIVCTYVEIIDDEWIEEYVNDQLIDRRPNPMGFIPVVHIANKPVLASPWGLSDVIGITDLNRRFNETATMIMDIINYYCVDTKTEALTRNGWKKHNELSLDDDLLTLDPVTDEITWQPLEKISLFNYDGKLVRWNNHIDALTTPNHRWLVESRHGRKREYTREIARTSEATSGDSAIEDLTQGSRIITGGGKPLTFSANAKWADELVELAGWYITEGSDTYSGANRDWHSMTISQSESANPEKVADIRRIQKYWQQTGATFSEYPPSKSGTTVWYIGKGVKEALEEVAPGKQITPEFLTSLTHEQACLFHKVLLDGDGTRAGEGGATWYQDNVARKDGYQMLCAMLGIRTRQAQTGNVVYEYTRRHILAEETARRAVEEYPEEPKVWCPTVRSGIWFARRNGSTYWTGNTAPVTVVTGSGMNALEKGANKVWAFRNKDVTVENLAGGGEGLPQALDFLDRIKTWMHELTGVPQMSLGESQPVSNTSGVALAIQYLPTMMQYSLKKTQYGAGIAKINEMALKTLFTFEPWTVKYDTSTEGIFNPKKGQKPVINPDDPEVYNIRTVWEPPLPIDTLIKLQEIQVKLGLELESKTGALKDLGYQFPDEKRQELFEEQIEDLQMTAAKQVLSAHVAAFTAAATGFVPSGNMEPVDQKPVKEGETAPPVPPAQQNVPELPQLPDLTGIVSDAGQQMFADLLTQAYGTKLPSRRMSPDADQDNTTGISEA